MFTKPDDLPESAIAGALHDLWGFTAESLEYQPVGFGSLHWLATDATGRRLFATVDDLTAKRRTARDTTDAALDRLAAAFATALALRGQIGLTFVSAPVPAAGRQVVVRLSARYSLVVHPYVSGEQAGADGEFTSDDDRRAVLGMLIQLHDARADEPHADDFVVPNLDALQAMIRTPRRAWRTGPYAQPAQDLLHAHASDLRMLVRAYYRLAHRVSARPDRMVITHGEPNAGNVLLTGKGLVLVDRDSALLPPPERDLWALAGGDESLLNRYAVATGVEIDDEALTLYRLWYDLAEIGGYLSLFRSAHEETADTRQSWGNLQHFLRPAERWPQFMARTS